MLNMYDDDTTVSLLILFNTVTLRVNPPAARSGRPWFQTQVILFLYTFLSNPPRSVQIHGISKHPTPYGSHLLCKINGYAPNRSCLPVVIFNFLGFRTSARWCCRTLLCNAATQSVVIGSQSSPLEVPS
jgi:hypothetical protein